MFLILFAISRKVNKDGVVVWAFIALYGLFRFLVEFVREPDEQIGYLFGALSMGQMLSLPMFLLGAAMVVQRYRRGD